MKNATRILFPALFCAVPATLSRQKNFHASCFAVWQIASDQIVLCNPFRRLSHVLQYQTR